MEQAELVTSLKVLLANIYQMYFKAHGFHWNVEGSNFAEMHGFFEKIYEDVFGSADDIAEFIRTLNAYAPFGLYSLTQYATISDSDMVVGGTDVRLMVLELRASNTSVLESLQAVYRLAEMNNEIGLSNFIQDRIHAHRKHQWMLDSYLK
jgi:starvation-inducible DNA-binding protein